MRGWEETHLGAGAVRIVRVALDVQHAAALAHEAHALVVHPLRVPFTPLNGEGAWRLVCNVYATPTAAPSLGVVVELGVHSPSVGGGSAA